MDPEMSQVLIDAITPILSDLETARNDYLELKAEVESYVPNSQAVEDEIQIIESNISEASEMWGSLSAARRLEKLAAWKSHWHEIMGLVKHRRDLNEWLLRAVCDYYIEVETALVQKILEVGGGDTALLETYVPARPGEIVARPGSPCRKLAEDERIVKLNRYFSGKRYRKGFLPTV